MLAEFIFLNGIAKLTCKPINFTELIKCVISLDWSRPLSIRHNILDVYTVYIKWFTVICIEKKFYPRVHNNEISFIPSFRLLG